MLIEFDCTISLNSIQALKNRFRAQLTHEFYNYVSFYVQLQWEFRLKTLYFL
jgi:hypothetical protein